LIFFWVSKFREIRKIGPRGKTYSKDREASFALHSPFPMERKENLKRKPTEEGSAPVSDSKDDSSNDKRRKLDISQNESKETEYGQDRPKTEVTPSAPTTGMERLSSIVNVEDQLEVLWTIDEASPSSNQVWWTCKVERHINNTHIFKDEEDSSEVEATVFELKYEAKPELDFASEMNRACFLSDHVLYDLEHEGVLVYRKAGSLWTPNQPGPLDSEPTEEGIVSSSTCERLVDSVLSGLLRKHENRFSQLPRDKQCALTDLVAASREKISEVISTKWEEVLRRGDSEMNADDVRDALSQIDVNAMKEDVAQHLVTPHCR